MADFDNGEVLVELVRGGIVESQHLGHVVILDADGRTKKTLGNSRQLIYPRSSIKSIQASAMVRAGLNIEPRLLALVSASHSGSQMHLDGVLEILAFAGLDQEALGNGPDKPLGDDERRAWGPNAPTSLAHNCSGKHAGMLLTCVLNDWTTRDYLSPEHPLQLAIRAELETLCQEEVSGVSIDGCGAPLFLLHIDSLARAIHALTISSDSVHSQVMQACVLHPEMVAGVNRATTRLMNQVPGLFLKEGAEGVGVGSLADGRTFAFKIADGSMRPYVSLVGACLRQFEIEVTGEDFNIYGGRSVVGLIHATF